MNHYRNNIRTSMDRIRAHKSRSFWTMLGVIIGVSSVIIIIGIGNGVRQQVGKQLSHYGKDLIIVRPAELHAGGKPKGTGALNDLNITGNLTARDVDTVAAAKGVDRSAPITVVGGIAKGDYGNYADGFVIATSQDLPSLLNQSLEFGAFWGDGEESSRVAVLGKNAADAMFDTSSPLGHTFTFKGQEFMVRGIFNDFHTSPLAGNANFDNAIFIPQAVANDLTGDTAPTYLILAKANKSSEASTTASSIKRTLNQSHGGQNDVSVLLGHESLDANNTVLGLLTRLTAGVASIALVVGILGIMNVMMVSVSERMHEIGIRKAIGATNRQIMHQFLLESSLLSLIGCIIGVAVAYGAELFFKIYTDLKPAITLELVLMVTAISLLLSIGFGMIPALKAARKDPIEALRAGNL